MTTSRTIKTLFRTPLLLLSVLTFSLSACGPSWEPLAIDKMPRDQMNAAPWLALNPDKPGVAVNIQKYLVPGKYTLVAFFSPYSPECMQMAPALAQFPQKISSVAVRTVNINRPGVQGIDWESPAAQSAGVKTLPYFLIYEPSQNLRAHGRPAYEQVMQWIRESQYGGGQAVPQ